MHISKRPFGLWDDEIYLTKDGHKYGLWDAGCQEALLPCEYEHLQAADNHCVVFQKNGRRGLMYYAGDIQILFDNVYDDIGVIAHRSAGLPFVWFKESGVYHIASIRGEILLRNLPHWQAVYLDASQTRILRYAWSNYCIWSTDYKACRSPLNLLIDELHYPLQFGSLEEVSVFGAKLSSLHSLTDLSLEERTNWIVAGWYHLVRRLDELSRLFGLEYHFAALQYMDNLGCCYADERVICLHPGLLRQPVNAVHSVLIHELCRLKCRRHGPAFDRLYAQSVEQATFAGFDADENRFVNYGQPFPQIDIETLVNKTLCDLFDNLADEQRKRLPLQKIPQ